MRWGWDGAFYRDSIALDSQWNNVGGHVYYLIWLKVAGRCPELGSVLEGLRGP
jgi:hypothetical protein